MITTCLQKPDQNKKDSNLGSYVEFGEVGEDLRESVVVVLLREFHLPHVEVPDAVDLVMLVYHRRRLPLSFG